MTDGTNLILSPRMFFVYNVFYLLEDTIHLSNKKLVFELETERPDYSAVLDASKTVREGNLNVSQFFQSESVEV